MTKCDDEKNDDDLVRVLRKKIEDKLEDDVMWVKTQEK
jgi:hypothetical protein